MNESLTVLTHVPCLLNQWRSNWQTSPLPPDTSYITSSPTNSVHMQTCCIRKNIFSSFSFFSFFLTVRCSCCFWQKSFHGVAVNRCGFSGSHLALHALNNILLDLPLSNGSVTVTVFRVEMPAGQNSTRWTGNTRVCHETQNQTRGSDLFESQVQIQVRCCVQVLFPTDLCVSLPWPRPSHGPNPN